MVDFALYTIWIAFPVFFFGLALWSKLELLGGKGRRADSKDLLSQAVFVSVCVGIAILADKFLLPKLPAYLPEDFLPLGFFRILLLPFIFLVAAKIVGPSKDLRILRAPTPVESRKKRKR